jgi:hypothetical protein
MTQEQVLPPRFGTDLVLCVKVKILYDAARDVVNCVDA